jgi:hypothetical protein
MSGVFGVLVSTVVSFVMLRRPLLLQYSAPPRFCQQAKAIFFLNPQDA